MLLLCVEGGKRCERTKNARRIEVVHGFLLTAHAAHTNVPSSPLPVDVNRAMNRSASASSCWMALDGREGERAAARGLHRAVGDCSSTGNPRPEGKNFTAHTLVPSRAHLVQDGGVGVCGPTRAGHDGMARGKRLARRGEKDEKTRCAARFSRVCCKRPTSSALHHSLSHSYTHHAPRPLPLKTHPHTPLSPHHASMPVHLLQRHRRPRVGPVQPFKDPQLEERVRDHGDHSHERVDRPLPDFQAVVRRDDVGQRFPPLFRMVAQENVSGWVVVLFCVECVRWREGGERERKRKRGGGWAGHPPNKTKQKKKNPNKTHRR